MNTTLRLAIIAATLASAAPIPSAFAETAPQTATQSIGAGDLATLFPSLVAEARAKTPSPSDTGMINTHLSTAEWHWARGEQAQALSYLNFARGKLGLSHVPAVPAVQQASRPSGVPAVTAR
ncbi:hypothetical protein [Azospirillum canadense]|uniref:hypothetical protein n=1 Tax=Azospirillum canadense TaxID=403962 RepID=UPI0022270DC7|nr:hypothetical protein [Azospirillum canadense]MCW2242052.1 hypothetical protein [Azospirillum canadense]